MRTLGDENDFDGDSQYVVRVSLRELMRAYRESDEAWDPDMLERSTTFKCMKKAGWRPIWAWHAARKR